VVLFKEFHGLQDEQRISEKNSVRYPVEKKEGLFLTTNFLAPNFLTGNF